MPKVVKSKNKFYVLIPQEIVDSIGIKEGEELELSRRDGTSFVVARKGAAQVSGSVIVGAGGRAVVLSEKELDLLRKLDTMRYNERTKEKVESMLNAAEKATLSKLMEKRYVTLYRKDPKEQYKYGIAKGIYQEFLFGKRVKAVEQAPPAPKPQPAATVQQKPAVRKLDREAVKKWEERSESSYIEDLETKGYVVLRNEADAASASAALEDSIKQGLVIGTRAFDKRFYIGLRGFINKNGPKIMRVLERGKSVSADEIAAEVGIDVDAVKTIIYILAEKGDVTEVRREVFRIA
jgi:bifunctional DNA-binding transcriptional regulator/antitoxin component of YhaV-PrlF toxin-antitoxin module